jgi:hypothetical protein
MAAQQTGNSLIAACQSSTCRIQTGLHGITSGLRRSRAGEDGLGHLGNPTLGLLHARGRGRLDGWVLDTGDSLLGVADSLDDLQARDIASTGGLAGTDAD